MVFSVNSEQLVVWHQKNGATPILEKILSPIATRHSLDLSVTYIATTDLKTALIKSVLNKSEPNIALVPSDFFGEHETLQLQPISDSLYQAANLDEQVWRFAQLQDKTYGIPFSVGNHLLLYYNKNKVNNPVTEWQQLFELSRGLPENQRLIGWNYKELFWFINFVPMFGEMPVTDDGLNLESPAMKKAIRLYRELSRQGVVDINCDYTCSSNRFEKGDFLYTVNGDWAYLDLKAKMGDDLGVTSLPSYQSVPMKSLYSAIAMIFPKGEVSNTEKRINHEVALALLSDSAQADLFMATGSLPARKLVRDQLVKQSHVDYVDIVEVLESGIAMPSTPAMSAAWAGMRKGIDYYFDNEVSEMRAMAIMQRVAERQLQTLEESN